MYPHTRPRQSTGFLIALAVFVMTIGFLSRDAFADHRQKKINVGFEHLSASYEGDKLQVSYEIKRKDWKKLKRAGIDSKLNVYGYSPKRGSQFLRGVQLNKRSGTVYIRAKRFYGNEVLIRLAGHTRGAYIGDLGFKKQCGEKLTVAVKKRSNKGYGHGFSQTELASMKSVCSKHYISSGKCFDLIRSTGKRSPRIFSACNSAVEWSSDFKRCVSDASLLKGGRPALVIDACAGSTEWASDFKACMARAGKISTKRAQTIRACSAATEWQSDFKNCLDVASTYTTNASPVIAACDAHTEWASDFKRCLKTAKPHGRVASEVVSMCGEWTEWTSDFNRCVERGGLGRHARR